MGGNWGVRNALAFLFCLKTEGRERLGGREETLLTTWSILPQNEAVFYHFFKKTLTDHCQLGKLSNFLLFQNASFSLNNGN